MSWRSNEYVGAFRFGIQLLSLLTLLVAPLILWGWIAFSPLSKLLALRIFTVPSIEILSMSVEKETADKAKDKTKNAVILKFGSVEKLDEEPRYYLVASRSYKSDAEKEAISREANRLLENYDRDVELGLKKSGDPIVPAYGETAVYQKSTPLGSFTGFVLHLLLALICLALYFPLFRAIINLFRSRKKRRS